MVKKIALALLLTAITLFIWQSYTPRPLTVNATTLTTGLTESTVVNTRAGTITACQRAKLALAVGGQIAAINVKEGQQVKQGDILLNLWNDDLKANINSAKANITAADFEQKSLCIIAQSDQREAIRLNNLVVKKLASQGQLDLAQAKANASKAACTAANARWQQSQALLAQNQAILKKTFLTAPFDGTIAQISGEVGEFSTPSPPGVATPPAIDLLTTQCHYIEAPIDEVDAGKIAIAMPVRITLDAFREQVFYGKIRRIAPYVQDYAKQARTVTVEVDFDSTQNLPKLLAGYSVDVEIILAQATSNLRVPTDAIIDNQFLYIVNNQGVIEKKAIEVGLSNWQFSEVISGVTSEDLVITNAASISEDNIGQVASVSIQMDIK